MGTFDVHTDLLQLPELQSRHGLAAHGLYLRAGAWTGRHGRTGVVPADIVKEFSGGHVEEVQLLIDAGLWERLPDGSMRMLRGPSSDPDLPLPLWRYSDEDLGGALFRMDDTPNT